MGLLLPLLLHVVHAKDGSGLLNGIYLRSPHPPPFTFFFGGGLFGAINLSLEIFKKCSYDLFDFFYKKIGFFYFCVLELILGFKIMSSLVFLKKLSNPVDF
jgi:hypothetical protein